jgi:hypothetical protein
MADPVTSNGNIPPPPMWAPTHLTDVVEHLDIRDLMLERGTTGLKRAGGYVREDFLPDLIGQQAIRKFREMRDNSPVIGACLFAIEMLIRNVRWRLVPADTSDEAQGFADVINDMLFEDLNQSWSMLLSEILSFLPFGFSYFEMIFKRRLGPDPRPLPDGTTPLPSRFSDGAIGLGKIAPRGQESVLRWEFDHAGELRGMHQMDPWMGRQAYLPYEKCLLFRPTSYKDSPEGRSVLRTAYRPWYMATHIENTEGIGIERDLTGLPTIGTPPQWWSGSASPEEQAQLATMKTIGRNIRQDEQACLVYPLIYDPSGKPLFHFELAHAGGAKAIDTNLIIQRYELRITQSLLCDLLFLGHEDVGSFALASSKSTTQSMSLGGYLTVTKDEFNRKCLPLLWRLNAWPEPKRPTLDHGDIESVDLTELARFMLSFGRIFNMQDLENTLRTRAGLPEREGAETNPLPASIQPSPSRGGTEGFHSHGGGSGTGIEAQIGGGIGGPDLDRELRAASV